MDKRKKRRQHLQQIEEKLVDYQLPEEVREATESPPAEDARDLLVEQRIQKAMAEGAFDNLAGRGKPLDLKKNPYLDSSLELAFDLLQNNQGAPEWIERDKEIRRDRDAARRRLRAAWRRYQAYPPDRAAWQAAVAWFEARLRKINRKIDDFNLIAPALSCHRPRLRLADELRRARDASPE